MIVILDYGMGNVCSIKNMLNKLGIKSIISGDSNIIKTADKIIIPGVGAFDSGIKNLTAAGIKDVVETEARLNKKPVLGICLGMQLLGRRSDEGTMPGLGLIPFETKHFNTEKLNDLKIPHMGWDFIESFDQKNRLLCGIESKSRYYFVHSYHAVCDEERYCIMSCSYGYQFAAAVNKDNIYGVQFHPEKSLRFGMKILENFARRC